MPDQPERLQRTEIYRSRWVNLYVDKVRFPNGSIIEKHHLLDFELPAVAVVARDAAGCYLMVKVCRYTTGRAEWEFPAGGVEPGEEIAAAAERELREETGYQAAHLEVIYTYHPMHGIANKRFYITRCEARGSAGILDTHEISAVRWVPEDEIWGMIRTGEMQDGLTLTAFLLDQHI